MDVLTNFLEKSKSKRLKIAVIGDTLIDEYYAVKVNRISPEFPIVVMLSEHDQPINSVPGGAANVCYQMNYWNVDTYLISIIDDKAHSLISNFNINTKYSENTHGWRTPKKKRYYDGDFPIDRWDIEEISCNTEEWNQTLYQLINNVHSMLTEIKPDIVIISDYGKGIFNNYRISNTIINYCNSFNVRTIVDPKNLDYRYWENCTYLKPNADWVKNFCNKYGHDTIKGNVKWESELQFVKDKIKANSIVMTDSGNGMAIHSNKLGISPVFYSSCELSKHRPIIRSVIGAGDCFCAFLAMAKSYDFDIETSMRLAFNGSSAYIEDKHNSPVTPYIFTKWFDPIKAKKVSIEELLAIKKQQPGKKWVWTNGCFDGGLHVGHLKNFEEARNLGDKLVVGLNSDESVKQLKGDTRPIYSYKDREHILANLQYVDYIVPIANKTPEHLIKTFQPDKIVKGGDYKIQDIAGWNVVGESNVHIVPLVEGVSTTKLIERLKHG